MSITAAGIDGCRGGWICVLRNVEAPFRERAFLACTIQDVLSSAEDCAAIAIDIPIGMPDSSTGGRHCDRSGRAVLGKRASSVFAVPVRAAAAETDYRSACEVQRRASDPPRLVSKQMFHLFKKIRQVDAVLSALPSATRL